MPTPSPGSRSLRALPSSAPRGRPHDAHDDLVAIVRAARDGDEHAWTLLVRRFDHTLRHVAGSYRLSRAEVDDVVQTTWCDLFRAIDRVREPAALGAWLVTVTRRNALRRRQMHVRELLTDDPTLGDSPDSEGPEARLLTAERRAALAGAVAGLPERHRQLLTVLMTQPGLDYRNISELLSMPVGSIGPIRARALARLARTPELRAISDSAPAAGAAAPACISGGARCTQ